MGDDASEVRCAAMQGVWRVASNHFDALVAYVNSRPEKMAQSQLARFYLLESKLDPPVSDGTLLRRARKTAWSLKSGMFVDDNPWSLVVT